MSKMICFIALAFLAASASAQTATFFDGTVFCNQTAVDNQTTVVSSPAYPINTCQSLFNAAVNISATCNSTTGVITTWQFTDSNCTQNGTSKWVPNNTCQQIDATHSVWFSGCPIVVPDSSSSSSSTGAVNPAGSSSSSSSSTGGSPATPAPSSSGPQGGDATRAALSLFAASAVIVSALL